MSEAVEDSGQAIDVKTITLKALIYIENLPNRPSTYISEEFQHLDLTSTDSPVKVSELSELDPMPVVVVMGVPLGQQEYEMLSASTVAEHTSSVNFYQSYLQPLPSVPFSSDENAGELLKTRCDNESWCNRNPAYSTPLEFTIYDVEADQQQDEATNASLHTMNTFIACVYHTANPIEGKDISIDSDAMIGSATIDMLSCVDMYMHNKHSFASLPMIMNEQRLVDEFGRETNLNILLIIDDQEYLDSKMMMLNAQNSKNSENVPPVEEITPLVKEENVDNNSQIVKEDNDNNNSHTDTQAPPSPVRKAPSLPSPVKSVANEAEVTNEEEDVKTDENTHNTGENTEELDSTPIEHPATTTEEKNDEQNDEKNDEQNDDVIDKDNNHKEQSDAPELALVVSKEENEEHPTSNQVNDEDNNKDESVSNQVNDDTNQDNNKDESVSNQVNDDTNQDNNKDESVSNQVNDDTNQDNNKEESVSNQVNDDTNQDNNKEESTSNPEEQQEQAPIVDDRNTSSNDDHIATTIVIDSAEEDHNTHDSNSTTKEDTQASTTLDAPVLTQVSSHHISTVHIVPAASPVHESRDDNDEHARMSTSNPHDDAGEDIPDELLYDEYYPDELMYGGYYDDNVEEEFRNDDEDYEEEFRNTTASTNPNTEEQKSAISESEDVKEDPDEHERGKKRGSTLFLLPSKKATANSTNSTPSSHSNEREQPRHVKQSRITDKVDTSNMGPMLRMKQLMQENLLLKEKLEASEAKANKLEQENAVMRKRVPETRAEKAEERAMLLEETLSEMRRDAENQRSLAAVKEDQESNWRGAAVESERRMVSVRQNTLDNMYMKRAWRRACLFITTKMYVKILKLKQTQSSTLQALFNACVDLNSAAKEDPWLEHSVGYLEPQLSSLVATECISAEGGGLDFEWRWSSKSSGDSHVAIHSAPSRALVNTSKTLVDTLKEHIDVLLYQKTYWKNTANSYQQDEVTLSSKIYTSKTASDGNNSSTLQKDNQNHPTRVNAHDGKFKYSHEDVEALRTQYREVQFDLEARENHMKTKIQTLTRKLKLGTDTQAYNTRKIADIQQYCLQQQKYYIRVVGGLGGTLAIRENPLPPMPITPTTDTKSTPEEVPSNATATSSSLPPIRNTGYLTDRQKTVQKYRNDDANIKTPPHKMQIAPPPQPKEAWIQSLPKDSSQKKTERKAGHLNRLGNFMATQELS